MMDFNERVIPGVTANYLYQESLARYFFAMKYVKKNFDVIDVGCGTGYGSNLLSTKARVIGVDINKEAIEYAKKNYGYDIKFYVGDVNSLQFQDETFDMACSFEVIEHLKRPRQYLREVKRVLKEKGVFILSTPNKERFRVKGESNSKYHFKEYNQVGLDRLLKVYFNGVELYGQKKNKKSREAFTEFMSAQNVRQGFVNRDIFGLRKMVPRNIKEYIWRNVGLLFGNRNQTRLTYKDFKISKCYLPNCECLVAVCRK
jgi:ubiquinone/menaquinone biosynthesis C-methylase UbiE